MEQDQDIASSGSTAKGRGLSLGVGPPRGPIGESEAFLRVLGRVQRLASSDATVLITGETGTGKELVAQAIHAGGKRSNEPFIPVNCGALPEDLVENELFGHARGAYTGAAGAGRGLFAEAEGGTLFLDELNSLSRSAQAKILRFLQNREYRVLGSTRLLHANVRIIAATNVDLKEEIGAGRFRADLYHRLHVLSVDVPPLRDRRQDIPLLGQHFAAAFGELYGKGEVVISQGALVSMMAHDWPGNVRELQSVVERAVLLAPGSVLREEDMEVTGVVRVGAYTAAHDGEELVPTSPGGLETFRDAKSRMVTLFERNYLVQVMASVEGNVSRAARAAGMQRRDFQRLLRKHDVRRTAPRGEGG